jgi:hypothetical protein
MERREFQAAVMLIATLSAGPVSAADAPQAIPADTVKDWNVGVSTFIETNLPKEYGYLTASVPQLLESDLQGLETHQYSDAERSARQTTILQDTIEQAGKSLSDLVQKRDQIIFNPGSATVPSSQYAAIDKQILPARSRLAFLRGLSPSQVDVPREKPIQFSGEGASAQPGDSGGKLLSVPDGHPGELAAAMKVDVLVYGKISYTAGIAYLDIYAYNQALQRVDYHKEYASPPEQLYDWVPFAADELAGYLLGREWGSLRVQVEPASAAIRVDGTLIGFGSAAANYLPTGAHTVTVTENGYKEAARTVVLAASKTEKLSISLTAEPRGKSLIESTPTGANVYMGALWIGKTPLSVPLPAEPEEVRLSMKGYLDSHFLLSPDGPKAVRRNLVLAAIDWTKEIEGRRNTFYRNLGWFVLSVPIPVILNGLYQNDVLAATSSTFATLTPDAQNQVIVRGNAFYWASWGTAILSAGLFVNAFISLVEYIQAGQEYHVR